MHLPLVVPFAWYREDALDERAVGRLLERQDVYKRQEEGGPLLSFLDPNVKAELAQHMAYDATCRKLLKFVTLEST